MPRRVVGPLPARECVCIAGFYSPDVARELRRRARREKVGAGRIASRIVSAVVERELAERKTKRATKTTADDHLEAKQ